MAEKILIIGATSAIAQAVAREYAEKGAHIYMAGRNADYLQTIAGDLQVRYAIKAGVFTADFTDIQQHAKLISAADSFLQGIDKVLIAYGSLPDQMLAEQSVELTLKEFSINCTSVIALLTLLGNYFAAKKTGTIAVITSVAGDRGRQSNYVYGAAKGALNIFLQGLRNRLFKSGVAVVTIKPGFVDTPMTREFKKGLLWSQPDKVAIHIVKAMDKGKAEVYVPPYWRFIMLIIKLIPENLFKRLSL